MGGHPGPMTSLADLRADAPAIAAFIVDKIEATGLCILATTRSDGWPRVSPIEVFFVADRVYVGSMPNGVKALDLRRDPRCSFVTPLADKDDDGGEGKAFCRAREIDTVDEHTVVRKGFEELRGFDPIGEFGQAHLFELVIEGAAFQRVEGDEYRTSSWSAGAGRRERTRVGPVGESVDLPL